MKSNYLSLAYNSSDERSPIADAKSYDEHMEEVNADAKAQELTDKFLTAHQAMVDANGDLNDEVVDVASLEAEFIEQLFGNPC